MKKKIKDHFESSALFRFVVAGAMFVGGLITIGSGLVWLGNTEYTNKDEFKKLVNRADTMEIVYQRDLGVTNMSLAVMGVELENIKKQQDDAKLDRRDILRGIRDLQRSLR